jgi:hypothetical protein
VCHDPGVSEYSWPEVPADWQARIRRAWPTTVAALPLGIPISGEVIGRQPFGVFVQIDGLPEAMALAEITAMPRDARLPVLGARVTGRVIWHADHNHQVKIRLTEWGE